MSRPQIGGRVLAKYVLLQLPALAMLTLVLWLLRHGGVIPSWVFWVLIALWAVKDALLFPFLWRSYDPDAAAAVDPLVGAQGVARQRLDPAGYIRVGGELWQAELAPGETAVEEGETVRVREVRGLNLLVTRERDDRADP